MDKELPISPWPEWKIVSKIGEGSFGRVYKAQRTEKGRSFYSAIKIITIPASKGDWTVCAQNPAMKDLSAVILKIWWRSAFRK